MTIGFIDAAILSPGVATTGKKSPATGQNQDAFTALLAALLQSAVPVQGENAPVPAVAGGESGNIEPETKSAKAMALATGDVPSINANLQWSVPATAQPDAGKAPAGFQTPATVAMPVPPATVNFARQTVPEDVQISRTPLQPAVVTESAKALPTERPLAAVTARASLQALTDKTAIEVPVSMPGLYERASCAPAVRDDLVPAIPESGVPAQPAKRAVVELPVEVATATAAKDAGVHVHRVPQATVKEDSPVSDMIKPPADMPAELIGERSSDITRPVPAKAAETLSAEETVLATERQVEPKKIVQAKKTEETGGDLPQFKAVAQAPSKAEPARLAEVRPEAGVRRKEVIDQVMTAMRGAQLRNQSEVRVRLEPQELGEVWIKVTNQGGTLAADFKVTTDFARAAIVEKLPELRQGLVDQGIKVSTMTCDLGQTMGGQSGQSHDRRDYRPVYQNFLRDHTPAVREIPRAKAYASTGLDMIA